MKAEKLRTLFLGFLINFGPIGEDDSVCGVGLIEWKMQCNVMTHVL